MSAPSAITSAQLHASGAMGGDVNPKAGASVSMMDGEGGGMPILEGSLDEGLSGALGGGGMKMGLEGKGMDSLGLLQNIKAHNAMSTDVTQALGASFGHLGPVQGDVNAIASEVKLQTHTETANYSPGAFAGEARGKDAGLFKGDGGASH